MIPGIKVLTPVSFFQSACPFMMEPVRSHTQNNVEKEIYNECLFSYYGYFFKKKIN